MLVVKNPPANAGEIRDMGSTPGLGRFPGEGNGNSTPVFLPGKFHGQRNLAQSMLVPEHAPKMKLCIQREKKKWLEDIEKTFTKTS